MKPPYDLRQGGIMPKLSALLCVLLTLLSLPVHSLAATSCQPAHLMDSTPCFGPIVEPNGFRGSSCFGPIVEPNGFQENSCFGPIVEPNGIISSQSVDSLKDQSFGPIVEPNG